MQRETDPASKGGNAAQQDAVDCWVSAGAASAHRSIGGSLPMSLDGETITEGARRAARTAASCPSSTATAAPPGLLHRQAPGVNHRERPRSEGVDGLSLRTPRDRATAVTGCAQAAQRARPCAAPARRASVCRRALTGRGCARPRGPRGRVVASVRRVPRVRARDERQAWPSPTWPLSMLLCIA